MHVDPSGVAYTVAYQCASSSRFLPYYCALRPRPPLYYRAIHYIKDLFAKLTAMAKTERQVVNQMFYILRSMMLLL